MLHEEFVDHAWILGIEHVWTEQEVDDVLFIAFVISYVPGCITLSTTQENDWSGD